MSALAVAYALGLLALLFLAVRLGRAAARIEAGMRRLELVEEIPQLRARVGTVEGIASRNTADIHEMQRQSRRITLPEIA